MKRLAVALLLLGAAAPARGQVVSKTVGQVTMSADLARGWPGGVIVARLSSRGRLGTTYAILDGRRALFYDAGRGPRALVPVPADAAPGESALGIEIYTRRGRQRIPLDIVIPPREYAPRSVIIPETRRHLPQRPGLVTQARQLLLLVRTESQDELGSAGALRPPVDTAPVAGSFGAPQTWVGGGAIEAMTDSIFGERHRGLDYEVPVGNLVQAPAAGTVLFAGYHELLGQMVVLDHGQGVVSVLAHLSRLEVLVGDRVEGHTPIGLSGDGGVAYAPIVHWRVYLHGVPIDPQVLTTSLD